MYNKTIIEFGFCGIRDNQGLGKCNQPRPYLDLDYSGYYKNLIQLLFIIDIVIAPIHWQVHGHLTSNNETVSRQMPLAGNIAKAMTSNGKQFTVTRDMLNAVSRDQRLPDVVCICFVLLDKKSPRILA